jgi:hypothetical protein
MGHGHMNGLQESTNVSHGHRSRGLEVADLLPLRDPATARLRDRITAYGGPGATRTPDKRFRKPLLYPPELRGHVAENRGSVAGIRASSIGGPEPTGSLIHDQNPGAHDRKTASQMREQPLGVLLRIGQERAFVVFVREVVELVLVFDGRDRGADGDFAAVDRVHGDGW